MNALSLGCAEVMQRLCKPAHTENLAEGGCAKGCALLYSIALCTTSTRRALGLPNLRGCAEVVQTWSQSEAGLFGHGPARPGRTHYLAAEPRGGDLP